MSCILPLRRPNCVDRLLVLEAHLHVVVVVARLHAEAETIRERLRIFWPRCSAGRRGERAATAGRGPTFTMIWLDVAANTQPPSAPPREPRRTTQCTDDAPSANWSAPNGGSNWVGRVTSTQGPRASPVGGNLDATARVWSPPCCYCAKYHMSEDVVATDELTVTLLQQPLHVGRSRPTI